MTEFGNRKLHWGSKGRIFLNAKSLRMNMTQAETILWNALRNNKLNGYKFRRQHPISRFIADFYCHEARLVIEIDGEIHNDIDSHAYDRDRSNIIKELDIKVIRFTNYEILNSLETVLIQINSEIQKSLTGPK